MKAVLRRATALTCVPFLLAHGPAQAAVQMVEVTSNGSEVNLPLPEGTQEVELESQRSGNCRFGRTWGYDLSSRQMWANGGCSGVFRLTIRDDAVPATASTPDGSNAAAGLAAMAAIAGVAILASQGNKHSSPYTPPPGYYPPSPPNAGYYPPPPPPPNAGYYPRPPAYDSPGGGYRPQPGGRQSVIRGSGGMCMDLSGGQARPGTWVTLFECHGKHNQQFYWTPRGEMVVDGLCLDLQGKNMMSGAKIVSMPCDGTPSQRWTMNGALIRSMHTGRCMDVANNQVRKGTPIISWDCHGGPNQRWFW